MMDYSQLGKIYKGKYASLSMMRDPMIPIWKDVRNFNAPRTARFNGEEVNSGSRQDLNIINSSVRFAGRTLAAGMQSGVTSPLRPWFRLGTADPDLQEFGPVKEWLYIVERLMRDIFARSNIYDRLKSTYSTLGHYGTSCLVVDEDEEDVARGSDIPIGSFMLSTSAAGRAHTLYRDVSFNPEQMIEKFAGGDMKVAADKLPQGVINAYNNGNYNYLYPLCHIIEPNRNYEIGSELSHKKKFASVFFDGGRDGEKSILSYKGYADQPFMAPRWDVLGEDIYGFGCAELALGDSKQIQLMEKRKLQGIDKNTNPTMLADSSMRNQRTTSLPGETVYVNGLITGRPGYAPAYSVNPYINELREEIQSVQMRIDEAYYKNLFLMISEMGDQPNITATQINMMREEKLLQLGPVLERLNDELLGPLIDRVFNMMQQQGLLPPAPEEIQGIPLRVEYISVLAQAQKAMGIGNIERFIGFVGKVALDSQDPTIWDKVNKEQTVDEYADGVAIPPTMINSDDVVAEIRAGRAKQTQMQQGAAMAEMGAKTAKTLSETNMGGDSALTRAMEGVSGLAQ